MQNVARMLLNLVHLFQMVQSSAVDFLHLLLVCLEHLAKVIFFLDYRILFLKL